MGRVEGGPKRGPRQRVADNRALERVARDIGLHPADLARSLVRFDAYIIASRPSPKETGDV